ncbi:phosphotriesterase family protein [Amycolatopsis jiangsuensis]|uniref:Phosphotriesterase-related protein n=1 Tax=Amycolatopsis jiangsuensis TaxID=1181879 RepID=A0A840ISN1_9PSEU|nr:phosphotriesterase [Amycolatopsis jiangsuensis]MBB4684465.1 phosphotriesterase-related protein [Amycolatopsis jiangsuensis]
MVETVRGAVAPEALGRVLMHEHIFVLSPEFVANYPEHDGFDESVHVPEAIATLRALKAAGIDTIVDPTVIGLGRYVPRVQAVAAATDLQIVVATGLYTYRDLPHYLQLRGPGTPLGGPEPLVEMFVGDLTEGIAGTGVKAGVLKCATDEPGLAPGVERVLLAVAEAHRRTGAPIMTHTHAGTRRGLDQQDVFAAEGVDLRRVLIGHCGDTTDLGYLTEIADRGSLLGMDRFGLDSYLPFEERVATVATLCERGYAGSMVLSHDAACYLDWMDQPLRETLLPNWHFLHITNEVLPALRARGVSEDDLTTMLVDNPRKFLAPAAAH